MNHLANMCAGPRRLCGRIGAGLGRRLALQVLMCVTAGAFRCKSPWILTAPDPLQGYGEATAEFLKSSTPQETDPGRLRRWMESLGRSLRILTGARTPEQRTRLVFRLYRIIGITMKGRIPGEITVTRCWFRQVYAPEDCARISAMDEGLMAGICGDGELQFYHRITEGCGCCRACFRFREEDHE